MQDWKEVVRDLLFVIIGTTIALGGLMFISTTAHSAHDASTAEHRPTWQSPLTLQNLYENGVAWSNYTSIIDDEMQQAESREEFAALTGEAYSVTMEAMAFMNTTTYPEGQCAQDMFYINYQQFQNWANLYGAMYHNLTAEVGEPIEIDSLMESINNHIEASFGEEAFLIDAKCWSKLDA